MAGWEWEEDRPLKHKGRKKAAGRAAARSILDQVAWCSWPLIYWSGLPDGSPLSEALKRRTAGLYALKMGPGSHWRAQGEIEQRLKALCPEVEQIIPINSPGLAMVLGQLLRSDHFGKSIERAVGNVATWKQGIEAALSRARQALDASREMDGPRGLVVESLSWWVGRDENRPSKRFAREILSSGGLGWPAAWRQAMAAFAGQKRATRRPEGDLAAWYACGRMLGDWPLDAVMQVARAIGPGEVCRLAAADSEISRPAVAQAMRDLALCAVEPRELRLALERVPPLLEISRQISAETWERKEGSEELLPHLIRMGLWQYEINELESIARWLRGRIGASNGERAASLMVSELIEVAAMQGIELSRRPAALESLERYGGEIPGYEPETPTHIRLMMWLGATGVEEKVARLLAGQMRWCAGELARSAPQLLEPLARWVGACLDDRKDLGRLGISGKQGVWAAWAMQWLDPGLVFQFMEWVDQVWPGSGGEALEWLGQERVLDASAPELRNNLLKRYLREMMQTVKGRDQERLPLVRWQKCVAVAVAWKALGWPAPLRAYRRFLEECIARPKWQPFENCPYRLWPLALAEQDLDRAVALASIRREIDWEQAELIEQAWKSLDATMRQRVSKLMRQERPALRAMRWLARAGFCLRLDRRIDWTQNPAGPGMEQRLGRWAIPESCQADMAELIWLVGAGEMPGKVLEVLGREPRLRQELGVLETMEHLPPAAWRRVENLKKWLRDAEALRSWIERDLAAALREAIDEAFLGGLEKKAAQVVAQHLERVIGKVHAPPKNARDWDNAVRLYYSTEKNRKVLRRLMIRESRGDRTWMRQHPQNRRFLEAMKSRGIDIEAWLGPMVRVIAVPTGKWHIALETEPLAVLQMGNYFGTCLSERGINSFATIANAVELNKRVIYVRDERGTVIGRKLIAMSWRGQIVGFRSYGVGPLDPWAGELPRSNPWMKIALDVFCRELADAVKATLHPFPQGEDAKEAATEGGMSLFCRWYNDGPEDFDRVWLEWGTAELRQSVRANAKAAELITRLFSSPDPQHQHQGIRAMIWLGKEADALAGSLDCPQDLAECLRESIARHSLAHLPS